jgi:hypothetical protein
MRYAAPPRLHSNNSVALLLAGVFALGAALFLIGTAMVRRPTPVPEPFEIVEEPVPVLAPWTAELAGTNDDVALEVRLDMVERLAMLDEPWCVALLKRARAEDLDASIRDAADDALLVIAARPRSSTDSSRT